MSKTAHASAGLAVVIGLAFSSVLPAAAQETTGTATSSAFALGAEGLIAIQPTPHLTGEHGFQQRSVLDLNVAGGLVEAGVLNTEVDTYRAAASVTDLRVGLGAATLVDLGLGDLAATAVEATCEQGQGDSRLVGASLGGIALDAAAPPNTGVDVPGLATVLLNRQVTGDDGSLTVTALSIELAGLQSIDIASATCAAGAETPAPEPEPEPEPEPSKPAEPEPSEPGDEEPGDEEQPPPAPRPTPIRGHHPVTG
ncbi:choice-of-anchor P family protein [Actinoalloteichus hymeniacidonis]|uniref:Uncharacterized protein n=1 Tax=Actinoalloteichus hymeniacidonis TaxID=340345 RepID=A0AAC9N0B3_9PSEU|nr:choice-of-anchor P family protein [Actinoalloteichus hymeniacidonis]AOS65399.1 hypothetical protein TL08_23095 [Actinoalloteichus hymeniacidonis]MBB5906515.1 hypothetical protein [Actinoalloteichus hymeniacidonis]